MRSLNYNPTNLCFLLPLPHLPPPLLSSTYTHFPPSLSFLSLLLLPHLISPLLPSTYFFPHYTPSPPSLPPSPPPSFLSVVEKLIDKLKEQGDTVTEEINNGITKHNREGDSPLHLACRKGHLQVAELLLKSGAGVDDE